MRKEGVLTLVQPYLILLADGLEQIFVKNMGISHFYEFKVEKGCKGLFQAVPDGSTDLVFSIGGNDIKLYIGGTVFQVKQWQFEEGRTHFGVCFHPGQTLLPRGLTIQEVVNADLELDRLEYEGLGERLAQAGNIVQRAEIFLAYYRKRIEAGKDWDSVHSIEQYVRGRIYESQGNVTIRQLGQETGYSECYIRRSFERIHGISPKVFERFVRFQGLLDSIHRNDEGVRLEELALDCGYYDQSHMMKDFKAFAGVTPETYRSLISGKQESFFLRMEPEKIF